MAPKLEHHFSVRACVSKDGTTKESRSGANRLVIPITGGFIEGKGLKANLLPGGGDSILIDHKDGVAYLNVRTHGRTATVDGIYIHYNGIMVLDNAIRKVIAFSEDAKTTACGDHEFFSAPQFETSSEEFKWIGNATWVGQCHWVVENGQTAVEYGVYRAVN